MSSSSPHPDEPEAEHLRAVGDGILEIEAWLPFTPDDDVSEVVGGIPALLLSRGAAFISHEVPIDLIPPHEGETLCEARWGTPLRISKLSADDRRFAEAWRHSEHWEGLLVLLCAVDRDQSFLTEAIRYAWRGEKRGWFFRKRPTDIEVIQRVGAPSLTLRLWADSRILRITFSEVFEDLTRSVLTALGIQVQP